MGGDDGGSALKAWVCRRFGPPSDLRLEDVDEGPVPADRVRVRVEASSVNFFDALLVGGSYQVKPQHPFTPGAEAAGVVVSAPAGSALRPGTRVYAGADSMGLLRGSHAEILDADPKDVWPLPDGLPGDEAVAMFVTFQTAHLALHRRGGLQAGETLLVHAGAGGVGSAAIQLGKAAGAKVIATAGSGDKVEFCRSIGADLAIDYTAGDFVDAVKEFTGGRGADVIYDPVGGDVFDRSTKCIAFEGRILVIGFTSGRIPQAAANHVLVKNYSVVGVHWGLYRTRGPEVIPEIQAELMRLYGEGAIKPHISARYPLERGIEAIEAVAGRRSTGKVLITP